MYWEQGQDVHNDAVTSAMSKNRFKSIIQNLHISDNGTLKPNEKFAKVRPILDHMNKQFKAHFVQEQTVSIDECMIPYYGKHGAKQYIHGKPIKFGYKVWVAATTLGYVIQFNPYQGAGTTSKEFGQGGSVVLGLAKSLPKLENQNYHLVFDNLFTSPQLLATLKDIGFAATFYQTQLHAF